MKNMCSAPANWRAIWAICSSAAKTCSICPGRARIPATIRWPEAEDMSRTRPSSSASRANVAAMLVSALVEQTAISGPACRKTPWPHSRPIALPTTLTAPMTCPPLRRSSCTAISVSSVSPDWLTATYSVSGSTTGLRYLNSDAGSASDGMRASSSVSTAPICPA